MTRHASFTFRLVILAGRFADLIVLPQSSGHHAQDFLGITIAPGVTPVQATQHLFSQYGVALPEAAIAVVPTTPEQGLVLLAAVSQDEADKLPLLYDFEMQPTDAAFTRLWKTGRMAHDFLSVLSSARASYEAINRCKAPAIERRPASTPA